MSLKGNTELYLETIFFLIHSQINPNTEQYWILVKGREGEKCHCVVASCVPPTGDLALIPVTCPDWESNQRPFGSQAGSQSTEPLQPGYMMIFYIKVF